MQFCNHTEVPALFWRTTTREDRVAAAVVARVAYDLHDGGLHLSDEQIWTIDSKAHQTPVGEFPPEDCFRRGGVDVMLFGYARASDGRPATKIPVRVEFDDLVLGVDVYGDRVWESGEGDRLVASEAMPIAECELSLTKAYGGRQEWDGLNVPYHLNPAGVGFYLDIDRARGAQLPNIEDPKNAIHRWEQQPIPVSTGLCPRPLIVAAIEGVAFDDRGQPTKLDPRIFNQAFPPMIAPALRSGQRCRIHGVTGGEPLAFALPHAPLYAEICVGSTVVSRDLFIDQIGVQVDERKVFITYRFIFRYTIVHLERRSCDLRWVKA